LIPIDDQVLDVARFRVVVDHFGIGHAETSLADVAQALACSQGDLAVKVTLGHSVLSLDNEKATAPTNLEAAMSWKNTTAPVGAMDLNEDSNWPTRLG
jgi:hypothetical protein